MTRVWRWIALVTAAAGLGCGAPTGADGGSNDAAVTDDGGANDATSGDGGAGCAESDPVLTLFETRCSNGSCHGPGGRFPELTRGALPMLATQMSRIAPGERLVVPGDPSRSFLFRKMAGTQGPTGGGLMPVGVGMPLAERTVLEQWIMAGAPSTCTPTTPPPPSRDPDPNLLDQSSLFTCAAGASAASSPARLRRIERLEWQHAVGKSVRPRALAVNNPFDVPEGAPFTTYSRGLTLDPVTLDLYFLSLPEAANSWTHRDPAADGRVSDRLQAVLNDGAIACMYSQATPSAMCIDAWLDAFIARGLLFRAPTASERTRLRALLVTALGEEAGDLSKRPETLSFVGQAGWLMAGALFRAEIGAAPDAQGRRRLTNDELGLALGDLLSTHPPGSSLPAAFRPATEPPPATDPDWSQPSGGWLGAIRRAAIDGTIQDPATIRRLIGLYRGGIDPSREDIYYTYDRRGLSGRGERWLAGRISRFFREYFDYGSANTSFKDTPEATTQWASVPRAGQQVQRGFHNLQSGFYGYESTLVDQLDDTIARIVIDEEAAGRDVFRALFTSRTWRLPSNLVDTNGVACTTAAQCTAAGYNDCLAIGLCGNSIASSTSSTHRVYGDVPNVANTREGRWVDVPATERAGVLTHPAWLAAHGGNFEDDASLVQRGRWIRENLFCESVPGLENVQVVAQLGPRGPTLSARQRVIAATERGPDSATCTSCHRLMNTLGYPFELFNHAGIVRATDHGMPPNATTTIDNAPDPALNRAFSGPVEFSTALAGSQHVRRCFVRHAFRYFMGRDETLSDACALRAMESAFAGGSFFAMLEALATSDAFLYRSTGGAR